MSKTTKKNSNFRGVMNRLKRNKLAMAGLAVIIIMVIITLLAPIIEPYPYDQMDMTHIYAKPSADHIFGTDDLGRDIFSRILYGGRYSLRIGIITVAMASVAGTIIGAIAGYFGNPSDMIIMRILDIIQAIPGFILSIAVATTLGPGFTNCIISLAIGMAPAYARLARASILNIRNIEYLEAEVSINASKPRIIFKHVVPNILSPIIVQGTMDVGVAILVSSALSFIGLGVRPPTPEWGAMLSAGRNFIRNYPHLTIFPGVTIMIAVLALNVLGDGLRDALDPKLKN